MLNKDFNITLNNLIGKRLQYICRSCDLIDFGFGAVLQRKASNGKVHNYNEYALHVQCAFRLSEGKNLLLGQDDLFTCMNGEYGCTDLAKKDTCLFDNKVKIINQLLSENPEYIAQISINPLGDLSILLNTMRIDIFITGSNEFEMWRLFAVNTDKPHLIRLGNRFEFI